VRGPRASSRAPLQGRVRTLDPGIDRINQKGPQRCGLVITRELLAESKTLFPQSTILSSKLFMPVPTLPEALWIVAKPS
jgi:hypothetical protein